MKAFFLGSFLLGLVLGVISMLVGIDRQRRRVRRTPVFNLPTVGALATALGASGYLLLRYSSLRALPVSLIAASVALGAALGVFGLIFGWVVPSAAREVEDERYRLQGHIAHMTSAVGPGGEGKIRYDDAGTCTAAARSLDGSSIAAGAEVVIERIENGVAYVQPWSKIERQLELPAEVRDSELGTGA